MTDALQLAEAAAFSLTPTAGPAPTDTTGRLFADDAEQLARIHEQRKAATARPAAPGLFDEGTP